MPPSLRSSLVASLLLVASAAPLSTASAQYFGRNKVQYEDFNFEVLKTEHFDIYYYPEAAKAAEIAGRMAERWYARISTVLEHELRGRQPVILYAAHPHFEQTNAVPGQLGEGTGGVTEMFKRRIVLPFAGPLEETDHVLGHELVHAFQFDITGSGRPGVSSGVPNALRLPLWFIEGMAEFLSVGPVDPHTAMWMRDAALRNLPTVERLNDPRFFPYRYGQALWSYIAGRWGDEVVGRILKAARTTGDARQAMFRVLGPGIRTLSEDWHAAIMEGYGVRRDSSEEEVTYVSETGGEPSDYGRVILTAQTEGGALNLAPSLSPDGERVVFLSEKDLFSIDMFLADATSGRVIRKITKTAADPHYESLQFINSAGSWDYEGRRFAFAAVTRGQPALTIVNTENGKVEKEVTFPHLGEIFNPSWSSDSRRIAFTAIVGGLTDLFVYDLELEQLRRLTNDPFAELHPVWSPDGKSIAFVTDRFSSNLDNLAFGNYRLALLHIGSNRIDPLPSFEDAKNINPQWSSDGKSLYFISDRGGISNIYRLDIISGEMFQVTDIFTGVSGITGLSPALSSSQRANRIAFSVYEHGRYNVYVADSADVLRGEPVAEAQDSINLAILPPAERITDDLVVLLDDPDIGLPQQETFTADEYQPRLSLDYIAQPSLVVGSDRFGTFVGGGAALFWSDMLGERNLATMLQINGGLKDVAALVGYENRQSRWNWGAVVQQVPYLTGGFGFRFDEQTGEDVLFERRDRLTIRGVSGVLAYPFDRARRVEFALGYRNVTFETELKEIGISPQTGQQRIRLDTTFSQFPALQQVEGTAALVYDNTIFGATAPILGQRYRVEVSPTTGSLSYVNLLGDVRRYWMVKRPFTLAARLLHFGRYGPDAEDERFIDLFLGYPNLVRGYDIRRLNIQEGTLECTESRESDNSSACPVFDQLLGSRLLVGNLELRFPLLGVLGAGRGFYGFLPIDMVLFADAGMAWRDNNPETDCAVVDAGEPCGNEQAFFFGGDRRPVFSAGPAMRFNAFGFLILQLSLARAFDRNEWMWQFSFVPGF